MDRMLNLHHVPFRFQAQQNLLRLGRNGREYEFQHQLVRQLWIVVRRDLRRSSTTGWHDSVVRRRRSNFFLDVLGNLHWRCSYALGDRRRRAVPEQKRAGRLEGLVVPLSDFAEWRRSSRERARRQRGRSHRQRAPRRHGGSVFGHRVQIDGRKLHSSCSGPDEPGELRRSRPCIRPERIELCSLLQPCRSCHRLRAPSLS